MPLLIDKTYSKLTQCVILLSTSQILNRYLPTKVYKGTLEKGVKYVQS